MPARILIVDDDAAYARALQRSLERSGHEVATARSAAEARAAFEGVAPEVAILDYQLPDANGLELLSELRPLGPGAVFLLNTAYPDLDVAVEAMRRGAFDFVAKHAELRECLLRVERAVEVARLRRRVGDVGKAGLDDGLLGASPAMARLRTRLDALATSDDTTAFIVGETGTGKGVVARRIHARSGRAYEPFVALDCTTIPATLVESELFGHERGAFSGATHSTLGRVEAAARGTLFLDEIGELELPIQTKLLRLLEEREFTRVGSTKVGHLDARVVTATNRDLARAVAEGRFRADLRYRLEVFVVEMPPLRERGEDIFVLAKHFTSERMRVLGRSEMSFDDEVLEALAGYPFPGNVRELRNMVEQAVLLAEGDVLTLDAFPVLARARTRPGPASRPIVARRERDASDRPTLEPPAVPRGRPTDGLGAIRRDAADEERRQLVGALEATGGNVAAAARQLGLSRYQVLRRLAKHGLR